MTNEMERRIDNLAKVLLGIMLAGTLLTRNAHAQTQPADSGASTDSYQTLYLTALTNEHDANQIQTDLRNMLPHAKLYYVPSQSALSIRGTPEDISLARKIVSDLDRTRKIYRLTYTITETDNGKRRAD